MNSDQIKGTLERAATVLATMLLNYFVQRGWIGASDVAALLPAIILVPSLIYGFYINSNNQLIQSAASVPGTVVVTQPTIAKTVPAENVVSNTGVQVVVPGTGESVKPSV